MTRKRFLSLALLSFLTTNAVEDKAAALRNSKKVVTNKPDIHDELTISVRADK